ncbi:hypothetical protein M0802_000314 [Mischocyttarus mexicanus]|nr:hypothetical protein M0802_000314 [Mischocyttarus mexicanus]
MAKDVGGSGNVDDDAAAAAAAAGSGGGDGWWWWWLVDGATTDGRPSARLALRLWRNHIGLLLWLIAQQGTTVEKDLRDKINSLPQNPNTTGDHYCPAKPSLPTSSTFSSR